MCRMPILENVVMLIKKTNTVQSLHSNILVYGIAGAGKTRLISTLTDQFVVSAEGGLLSLADFDIPYTEIRTLADIREVYQYLLSKESSQYQTIAIDSISEIAETILVNEKKGSKDPRQAYMAMQDMVIELLRKFRDLPFHFYATAKVERTQDEVGKLLYSPSMPGTKVGNMLPYFFDEVLALRVDRGADDVVTRVLHCQNDGVWQAKDRSGKLSMWENPDLQVIINKITK